MVAGVAALVLSRFPHLTAAQVTQALTGSTTVTAAATDRAGAAGAGHGIVNAARAVDLAAVITSASQPVAPASPPARPHKPARRSSASLRQPSAGTLAGPLLRAIVAGLGALIGLLVVLLLGMRSRRDRAAAPESGARPAP